jgi:hypothetical protein
LLPSTEQIEQEAVVGANRAVVFLPLMGTINLPRATLLRQELSATGLVQRKHRIGVSS